MNERIYIIHGWEGSPDKEWLPWLKKELEEKGLDVRTPSMPESFHPKMSSWVNHLAKIVINPDSNCYFVGHSLGCIAILRYLETLKAQQKIGGMVLLAGFAHDLYYQGYNGELATFFEKEINWDLIKSKCKKIIAINSDNDPFVPTEHNTIFKEKLSAENFIEQKMYHYNGEAGITRVPFVLEKVLELIGKKKEN